MKALKTNITGFVMLFFFTCTEKNELASKHYLKFSSMVIELEFVDGIQYPGQTVVITSNKQFLDTLSSAYMRIYLKDSTSIKDIYYLTMESCDLTVKYPERVRDFFVKVKIRTEGYSVVYLMKKRAVYDYYRTLFCKCKQEKGLSENNYKENLLTLRYVLSAVNINFIGESAYKENAFGLDTFCR